VGRVCCHFRGGGVLGGKHIIIVGERYLTMVHRSLRGHGGVGVGGRGGGGIILLVVVFGVVLVVWSFVVLFLVCLCVTYSGRWFFV